MCFYAAVVLPALGRNPALSGVDGSTRMNAPSRVRNRNLASTSVSSNAVQASRSRPHRRLACGSVNRKPGISRNSPFTRRSASSLMREGSGVVTGFIRDSLAGGTAGIKEQCMYQRCTRLRPTSRIAKEAKNGSLERLRHFGLLTQRQFPSPAGVCRSTADVGKPIMQFCEHGCRWIAHACERLGWCREDVVGDASADSFPAIFFSRSSRAAVSRRAFADSADSVVDFHSCNTIRT